MRSQILFGAAGLILTATPAFAFADADFNLVPRFAEADALPDASYYNDDIYSNLYAREPADYEQVYTREAYPEAFLSKRTKENKHGISSLVQSSVKTGAGPVGGAVGEAAHNAAGHGHGHEAPKSGNKKRRVAVRRRGSRVYARKAGYNRIYARRAAPGAFLSKKTKRNKHGIANLVHSSVKTAAGPVGGAVGEAAQNTAGHGHGKN